MGNEIYSGLIKDRFEPFCREKLREFSSEAKVVNFVPDDAQRIGTAIRSQIDLGCDLIR